MNEKNLSGRLLQLKLKRLEREAERRNRLIGEAKARARKVREEADAEWEAKNGDLF